MAAPPKLSQTSIGQAWIAQFSTDDRPAAAAMLDTLLLLNEEQVVTSIRMALDRIAKGARHQGKRVALYAEREFQEAAIFVSKNQTDPNGRLRRRAVGKSGPAPVHPIRGRSRVGSEGLLAFVASQQKDAWPSIFMNHPGPDRLRAKTAPAGEIIIVTDFIGSGCRIRSMLEKFWAVPTIRSWVSRKLIKFRVVAAATTASGRVRVHAHRLHPEVIAERIAPAINRETSPRWLMAWLKLVDSYGPAAGRGAGRFGFGDEGALIAFSYRIPNNTPALLHQSQRSSGAGNSPWHALYDGPAPTELHSLFGIKPESQIIDAAATENGVAIPSSLTEEERKMVLVLSLVRGRWRRGSEIALAIRSGLSIPVLMDTLRDALRKLLIAGNGRLTDNGYAFLAAAGAREKTTPIIATAGEPYYPEALRVPR